MPTFDPTPPSDIRISAREVRRRYGNVTDMTLWRWEHDKRLGFPKPIRINGRRYFSLAALERFDRRCAEEGRQGAPFEREAVAEQMHDLPDMNTTFEIFAGDRIWHSSVAAAGTLAETYFSSHGLHAPLPDTLRFHPALKHPSGGIWPAVIGLVSR